MGKKLAICIPYRNREQHLNEFVPYVSDFLDKQGIEHKIFVAHQVDDKLFNRGKTKNIAFDVARAEGYDYFCFHDVDMLPEDNSCDYSYPEENPVHISYHLSDYGYNLPYLENFGGAIIFTKEQYEQVNGYYNEYWDWGAEDDDIFWRCRRNGFLDIDTHATALDNRTVLQFNGDNSNLEIPCTDSLRDMMNGSYTLSFLVKTENRDDIDPYLRGKEDSEYIATPILSKGAFDHLVWVNTNVISGYNWNSKNEPTSIWLTNTHELWQHVVLTVDQENRELRLFINGFEATTSRLPLTGCNRTAYSDPFIVGGLDCPSWDKEPHSFFKGEIADIAFYKRALTEDEIAGIYTTKELNFPQDGLALRYDFSTIIQNRVIDISGNGNDGILYNIDRKIELVTDLQTPAKPHRRRGRFKNLPHQTEGIQNNQYVKGGTSARNEEILVKEVMTGRLDTSQDGVSNLEYKEVARRTIFDKHLMIDVEC